MNTTALIEDLKALAIKYGVQKAIIFTEQGAASVGSTPLNDYEAFQQLDRYANIDGKAFLPGEFELANDDWYWG